MSFKKKPSTLAIHPSHWDSKWYCGNNEAYHWEEHQQKAKLPLPRLLCPLRLEFGEDAFGNDFSPSNDNTQYHIRNEIEALILFFKYRIASILKLTYKFSIHLIFNSLLLSKCTYKEWITETVCNEIKFIFQICQFKYSQCLFSGHPTNVPKTPPSYHLPPAQPQGNLGTLEDESLKNRPHKLRLHCTPLSSGPVLFIKFQCSWALRSRPANGKSWDQKSRITAPLPWYLPPSQVALYLNHVHAPS